MRESRRRPSRSRQSGPLAELLRCLTWAGLLSLLVGCALVGGTGSSQVRRVQALPFPTREAHASDVVAPPGQTYPFPTRVVVAGQAVAGPALLPTAPSTPVPPSPSPTASLTPSLTPTPAPSPPPTPTPGLSPAYPTRIVIDAIAVDAPVLAVSATVVLIGDQEALEWEVPALYAAGWQADSRPPGTGGNTVLNGHNTTYGEVFRDLYTLQAGDVITVYAGTAPYRYAVDESLTVLEEGELPEVRLQNALYTMPTPDERLTLVTCHPYGSTRYRLIVVARPVLPARETRPVERD